MFTSCRERLITTINCGHARLSTERRGVELLFEQNVRLFADLGFRLRFLGSGRFSMKCIPDSGQHKLGIVPSRLVHRRRNAPDAAHDLRRLQPLTRCPKAMFDRHFIHFHISPTFHHPALFHGTESTPGSAPKTTSPSAKWVATVMSAAVSVLSTLAFLVPIVRIAFIIQGPALGPVGIPPVSRVHADAEVHGVPFGLGAVLLERGEPRWDCSICDIAIADGG